MKAELLQYSVQQLLPYIDWSYLYHAWGLPRHATETDVLRNDALTLLAKPGNEIEVRCLYRLCEANSDGDDLIVSGLRLPLLRQQTPGNIDSQHCLCLSDYIRPVSEQIPDTIGIFAATACIKRTDETEDPYHALLLQTIADRLVEAAAECMHLYIRQTAWGYAPTEHLTIEELLHGDYQGIRPAVGYPSLPDQSLNFLLDQLLSFKTIGITLTENGAMSPHASVSGLMISHPAAHYFSIGKIGEDQLHDYARRRGIAVEVIRKFLSANLQ